MSLQIIDVPLTQKMKLKCLPLRQLPEKVMQDSC